MLQHHHRHHQIKEQASVARITVSKDYFRGHYLLESNDVVTRLHICDTLANGLHDASTLVSQNNGEGTLGVLAGQGVGIGVADTGVVDLNADFVGFGGSDLDVFDGEVLASLPGDGGLQVGVSMSILSERSLVGFC